MSIFLSMSLTNQSSLIPNDYKFSTPGSISHCVKVIDKDAMTHSC